MMNADEPTASDHPRRPNEPPQSWLHRILKERPEARSRLGRAVAALLGTSLFALAALGALLIWHLVRRGRLIRERLHAPRLVRLPELPGQEVDPPS
jgi:hypothetical protein